MLPLVQLKVAWYLVKGLNEGWEFDDDHYHIVVKGEPSVETRIRFIAAES